MTSPTPAEKSFPANRRTPWHHGPGAAGVFCACLVLMVVTSPNLPMGWDEGNAILRTEGITQWAQQWGAWTRGRGPCPLAREAIQSHWQFTTQVEGHPAFYATIIAAGQAIAPDAWSPLAAARLGPILLLSLALAVMYLRLAADYSPLAGASAALAVVLQPRLFAHLHFASFDGPLVSCWILAWATFVPWKTNRRWLWIWGFCLGATMSCKATGWLAPLPPLAWAIVTRDRAAVRFLAWGIPIAAATFFLLNPPLWHQPATGLATFFDLNWGRSEFNIATQFLGHIYNRDHPLPFYNTVLWTAMAVPVGLLALFLLGLVHLVRERRREPRGLLLVSHWAVLIVVRALPLAPPHDAIRLILPAFAFLAAIAGVGASVLWHSLAERRRTPIAGVLLAAIFLGSATNLVCYRPQWLSHYNLLVGGLRGAHALGMEPTYYWDALDVDVRHWLAANTAEGEKVRFAAPSNENLRLMHRWGVLPVEYRTAAPGAFRWYVVQHRPSGWSRADRRLLENAVPAYQKTIRSGGWGPWRLDVPLVSVFDYADHEAAVAQTQERPQAP